MLDRSTDATLKLVRTPFDEARNALQGSLERMREKPAEPPIIQVGISDWVDDWSGDYSISTDVTYMIVDAMARYILHLRAQGKSSRIISEVLNDLQIAGLFLVKYETPKKAKRFDLSKLFAFPPNTTDFKRAFIDSDIALDRYQSNLTGFADFLNKRGTEAEQDYLRAETT